MAKNSTNSSFQSV